MKTLPLRDQLLISIPKYSATNLHFGVFRYIFREKQTLCATLYIIGAEQQRDEKHILGCDSSCPYPFDASVGRKRQDWVVFAACDAGRLGFPRLNKPQSEKKNGTRRTGYRQKTLA